MKLDHVALAVKNLTKTVELFEHLGVPFEDTQHILKSQGIKFCHSQDELIELISPLKDCAIQKYLAKMGDSFHHLSFSCSNIEKKCLELKNKGYELVYDKPVLGAHGKQVNFLHPKSTGGFLIEISQKE